MAKKSKRYNEVPVESIPEVAAYQASRKQYDDFREANPAFFKYLDELQEELDQKQEAAEKAVRGHNDGEGASCGDFDLYQLRVSYDVEALRQALGRKKFLDVGGVETTKTVLTVDKARVAQAIKSQVIPAEVAKDVLKKAPSFHKPDKLQLP